MMMTKDRIDNTCDVIDSRDVIARIEEIADELRTDDRVIVADELDDDERELWDELQALSALAEQGADYAPDWEYGETLVRDSYFATYAQELADDLGAFSMLIDTYSGKRQDISTQWPFTCIDWEQAARELQQDYTAVDFDGVTYWTR